MRSKRESSIISFVDYFTNRVYFLVSNRNDGAEFGGSIYQKVNDKLETAVNLAWTAGSNGTRFGIGAKYQLDSSASISVSVGLKEGCLLKHIFWCKQFPLNTGEGEQRQLGWNRIHPDSAAWWDPFLQHFLIIDSKCFLFSNQTKTLQEWNSPSLQWWMEKISTLVVTS